ncbi:MAG: glycosyltransferase, partial [Pseudomonadota bacterium]
PDQPVGMARTLYFAECPERIEPLIDQYLGVLGNRLDREVRAARVAIAGRREELYRSLLERARASAQDNPAILRALAGLQFSAGAIGDALNLLDEAHALAPEDEPWITRRRDALRALQVAGIQVESLTPRERRALRMPDAAFESLLRRAPQVTRRTNDRIVMVHATLSLGGCERQLFNTVRGLADLEVNPDIVLMPTRDTEPTIDWFRPEALQPLGVRIDPCQGGSLDLKMAAAELGPQVGDLLALLPYTLRRQISVLASRFLSNPPAVVHAWSERPGIVAGIAAALAGVSRIVLSSRVAATPGTPLDTYIRAVYRALADRPGVLLVNNSAAGARLCAKWLGVEPASIRVVRNGVEIDRLEAMRKPETTAAHRARLGLPGGAKVVGTLMRLSRQKRPALWLKAAAKVAQRCPEAHFVVLGEGPMREEMVSEARRLGIAGRLHMLDTAIEVAPWYDLMDVVLLTSGLEGTSNTALEAQALGVPVVSSNVGAMAETMVPNISGFLASSEPTPDELARFILRAITDRPWRIQAQAVGRNFIRERFSFERMIGDTIELYGDRERPIPKAV